jgi:hypothetical protein
MDKSDVLLLLKERVMEAQAQGITAAGIAIQMKLSGPSFLYDVLASRREPSDRILAWLGLQKVVTYEQVEPCQSGLRKQMRRVSVSSRQKAAKARRKRA